MQLGVLSCLAQALLVPISSALRPQSCLKSEAFCTFPNMRLHVQNIHCAPFPGAQKHDRKWEISKTHQNCTEGAPGERWGCATELQVDCREPRRRPNVRQRPSKRSKVAPWLCPSVLEPTLWTLSLRNVSSDPRLHRAFQRVPGEGEARAREPKRGPRGA